MVGNGLAMGLLGSVNFSIAGIRKEDFFFFFFRIHYHLFLSAACACDFKFQAVLGLMMYTPPTSQDQLEMANNSTPESLPTL